MGCSASCLLVQWGSTVKFSLAVIVRLDLGFESGKRQDKRLAALRYEKLIKLCRTLLNIKPMYGVMRE